MKAKKSPLSTSLAKLMLSHEYKINIPHALNNVQNMYRKGQSRAREGFKKLKKNMKVDQNLYF